jgi:hypothetical protein
VERRPERRRQARLRREAALTGGEPVPEPA